MNHEDLHETLERMGREPVPEPRKEFVDSLLPRLQMVDDLTSVAPTPAQLRQPWARMRLIAVGGVAAVLLGAVGFLSLVGTGGNGDLLEVEMTSSSGGGVTINGEPIGEDGQGAIADGDEVVCEGDRTLQIEGGRDVPCPDGVNTARVTMDGDLPTVVITPTDDEVAASDEATTTTESAPSTSVTTATPQSTGQVDSTTTESTQLPGIDSMGPLDGTDVESNQLSLSWDAWEGDGLDRYAVLRTVTAPGVEPEGDATCTETIEMPRYGNRQPAPGTAVWLDPVEGTSLSEAIDLEEFTNCVAYRVVALDANDNLLAETDVRVYALQWAGGENEGDDETVGPATSVPAKQTTTTVESTTSTTVASTSTSTTAPTTSTTVGGGSGATNPPTSTTSVVDGGGGAGLNGEPKVGEASGDGGGKGAATRPES
ncbi:MAG: hypothetical protein S0880_07895 [Actinomycetota bacterium]|nr:hypothetical protein [Actinomycetota bacterium]